MRPGERFDRVPPSSCPYCGRVADAATSLDEPGGELFPHEGDFTVCIGCCQVCVFDGWLRLRLPTRAELEEAMRLPVMVAAMRMLPLMPHPDDVEGR